MDTPGLDDYIKEKFEIRDVIADGNCFFRAISVALTGSEDAHATIRRYVLEHVYEDPDKLRRLYGKNVADVIFNEVEQDTSDTGRWSGNVLAPLLRDMFSVNIVIYQVRPGANFVIPGSSLIFYNNVKSEAKIRLLLKGNHFQLLYEKKVVPGQEVEKRPERKVTLGEASLYPTGGIPMVRQPPPPRPTESPEELIRRREKEKAEEVRGEGLLGSFVMRQDVETLPPKTKAEERFEKEMSYVRSGIGALGEAERKKKEAEDRNPAYGKLI